MLRSERFRRRTQSARFLDYKHELFSIVLSLGVKPVTFAPVGKTTDWELQLKAGQTFVVCAFKNGQRFIKRADTYEPFKGSTREMLKHAAERAKLVETRACLKELA